MASFLNSIGKRKKPPDQLVSTAKTALSSLQDNSTIIPLDSKLAAEKTIEKRLHQMKVILYGENEATSSHHGSSSASNTGEIFIDEAKTLDLSRCLQADGLLFDIISNMSAIPFEARKDAALIFNNLTRKNISNFATVYLSNNFFIVNKLIHGYYAPESALSCGSMLREIIRYEHLHRLILYNTLPDSSDDSLAWIFFDTFVHLPNFDVASDAFNTLRDLLVSNRNKNLTAEFLERRYDIIFQKYDLLLNSDNYVTRRRSLKMLGEILLDRSNFNVMIRFISSKNNLKTIMNLLRDKSPNIQFEAFHVFKVFVANPRKPADISSVLFKNKSKLIAYLTTFHSDKADPQFVDEKTLLIETLSTLEEPEIVPKLQSKPVESNLNAVRDLGQSSSMPISENVSQSTKASSTSAAAHIPSDAPVVEVSLSSLSLESSKNNVSKS